MAAGNLWINLGLRSAAFDKGLKRSKTNLRGFGSAVKGMGRSLLTVAGIGGFGMLIRQQLKTIDSTAKLSDRIGITTEALVALQHGASIAGVETETLNKSMEIFSRRLGEIQLGTGEAQRALDALGLSAKQLSEASPDEAIGIIADEIKNLTTQTEKAAVANFLFGRSGQQLLNLFEGGSQGIREFQREVERLGLSFSRLDAAKVEEANDAMTRVKAAFTGLVRSATIELAPFMEGVAESLQDVLLAVRENSEAWGVLFGTIGKGMKEIIRLPETLRSLATILETGSERAGAERQRSPFGNVGVATRIAAQQRAAERESEEELEPLDLKGALREGQRLRQERQDAAAQEMIDMFSAEGIAGRRGITSETIEEDMRQREKFEQHMVTIHAGSINRQLRKLDEFEAAQKAAAEATAAKWQAVSQTMEFSMTNAFDRIVFEAATWKDAMTGILRDVAREIARVAVFQPLTQGIMGAFGLSTTGAPTPVPVTVQGGGFHSGGTVPNDGLFALQRGEHVTDRANARGGTPPTVIINNNSGTPIAQDGPPRFEADQWVVGVVSENIANRGILFQQTRT